MLDKILERIALNPNDAQAHWEYGCYLGFTNRWKEAWKELEWRFKGNKDAIASRKQFKELDWDGKSRVLIYQDQGFGDLFQYCRFMKGLDCDIITHPCVYNLLKSQEFNINNRKCNYVSPVCSLAYYLKIEEPTGEPYLIAPKSNRTKGIGVAWAGKPGHFIDRFCKPTDFLPLAKYGELISLMTRKSEFVNKKIKDFADTAELINQLDFVVTVDTAVAHLAGALGKRTYLLLSYNHDFKWGTKETTPWYSSMTIIRQNKQGDWDSVFTKLMDMLK